MRSGGPRWWVGKLRQLRAHVRAGVDASERAGLTSWLSPGQCAMFDAMAVADQRHGLDVVGSLRADGVVAIEVLTAGLLHDAGKGATGVIPRAVHALGHAYGSWLPTSVRWLPGMAVALDRLARHPETSAQLAAAAGCSTRTVELIRWQEAPRDPEFGDRLRLADEAN